MYQILIVDDEMIECQYLKGLTNWKNLGIDRVHMANSMEQAVAILKREPVSVVICDIEMPRQSGVELLDWIRSREYRCEFIFVTCHASFDFAQKAIRLGSSDYLLKPVEENEVVAAVSKALVRFQNTVSRADRSFLVERFVGDAAQGKLGRDVGARLSEMGLEVEPDATLAAFLFFIDWDCYKEMILTSEVESYLVQNIIFDAVFEFQGNILTARIGKACYLVLAPLSLYRTSGGQLSSDSFQKMIDQCQRYMKIPAACVIASPCLPAEVGKTIANLFQFREHNICVAGKIVWLGKSRSVLPEEISFDPGYWATLLAEGNIKMAYSYFDQSVKVMEASDFIAAELLTGIFSEMIQGLYKVLRQKNIALQDFLPLELWENLHSLSLKSLHNFVENIHMLMDHFDAAQTPSVGRRIESYIQNNLGKNITREDVARHVGLTPEYISRIFKKETGMTLSEYIIQEKIETAKQLLATTTDSISSIASGLGYNSFSLFTKQFRDLVGITPSAFRRKENLSFH